MQPTRVLFKFIYPDNQTKGTGKIIPDLIKNCFCQALLRRIVGLPNSRVVLAIILHGENRAQEAIAAFEKAKLLQQAGLLI